MWPLGNYIQGRAYCMGWLLQSCGSILPFLLGWSAWGRPHEIGRAGECLGIFGKIPAAPMLEESNNMIWQRCKSHGRNRTCDAVPHLCTFDLKSGGIQRKVTETWWELAEKMVAPCPNLRLTTRKSAWQLHHKLSTESGGPGSLQRSLLQLPRICTNQCCLASWVRWLALEWRYLLSQKDWHWQRLKWSIWYDVFYILPLIHVDSLSNSDSPTALWAHHVCERTLGGPAGSHSWKRSKESMLIGVPPIPRGS